MAKIIPELQEKRSNAGYDFSADKILAKKDLENAKKFLKECEKFL